MVTVASGTTNGMTVAPIDATFDADQEVNFNFFILNDYSTSAYSALTATSIPSPSPSSSSSSSSSSSLLLTGDLLNISSGLSNGEGNITRSDEEIGEALRMVATSIILGLMILITIIGNVFVIAAIILERNLQNVANYLVASLAVADLFVACLVMPLGAVYEIRQGWILGPELCDIWTSCDVLCCTASILHLVAIAVDRYWAVTNIDYIHSRSSRRVFFMIFCVWTSAVIVSLAPQFGWKDPDYLQRIQQQKCMVSQDVAYQVFATCCTFYVPLFVILVLYWKIYQTARKRIHRRRPRPAQAAYNNNKDSKLNQLTLRPQKKRKRLRLRMGKEDGMTTTTTTTTTTTMTTSSVSGGLIEGNSTNTVDTIEVEDTEFSSSNLDNKSRTENDMACTANIDINEEDEISTALSTTTQLATVSHLVALAHQEQQQQQQQQQNLKNYIVTEEGPLVNNSTIVTYNIYNTTTTTTTTATTPAPGTMLTTVELNKKSSSSDDDDDNDDNDDNDDDDGGSNTSPVPNGVTIEQATGTMAPTSSNNDNNGDIIQFQHLDPIENIQSTTIPTTTTVHVLSILRPQSDTVLMDDASTPSNNIPTASDQVQRAIVCREREELTVTTTTTTITTTMTTTTMTTTMTMTMTTMTTITINENMSSGSSSNKQISQPLITSIVNPLHKVTKRKETLEAKRERKAAKTLAIITGAFVVCWLPFFVMALLLPLCNICQINDNIASLFLWLGYFNSTLNPVIYTIFSPEFRQAFKHILFGRHRPIHYRSGKM